MNEQLANIEEERLILSSFLLERDGEALLARMRGELDAGHFYREAHKVIFSALCELQDRGKPLELATLMEHLRMAGQLDRVGGVPTVMDIGQASCTTHGAESWAETIRKLARRRAIVEECEAMKAAAMDTGADVEEITAEAIGRLSLWGGNGKRENGRVIDAVLADFEAGIQKPFYPTGIDALDRILDGGLYEGLTILGGIPSIGKTSLCMQCMESIAAQGHDVMIFSLEMSERELVERSLCRLIYAGNPARAACIRDIQRGRADGNVVLDAAEKYRSYCERIHIVEGAGNLGHRRIRSEIVRHHALTGRYPVCCIDYCQILAPDDPRMTDKQATDKNVLELKRISRDYSIPILLISSVNRASYGVEANLSIFKESGALEFGADTAIGLQFAYQSRHDGETDSDYKKRMANEAKKAQADARAGRPVSVEAHILKQRSGMKGFALMETCQRYFFWRSCDQGNRFGREVDSNLIEQLLR